MVNQNNTEDKRVNVYLNNDEYEHITAADQRLSMSSYIRTLIDKDMRTRDEDGITRLTNELHALIPDRNQDEPFFEIDDRSREAIMYTLNAHGKIVIGGKTRQGKTTLLLNILSWYNHNVLPKSVTVYEDPERDEIGVRRLMRIFGSQSTIIRRDEDYHYDDQHDAKRYPTDLTIISEIRESTMNHAFNDADHAIATMHAIDLDMLGYNSSLRTVGFKGYLGVIVQRTSDHRFIVAECDTL